MKFTSAIEIRCPPAVVFDVYLREQEWPSWTQSVTSVERLEPGPFGVGARSQVRQPRLPVSEWVVTELVPGETFTWEASGPGFRTIGRHLIQPQADGCKVVAELEQRGVLSPLIAALTGKITRRYLQMETLGLKERCERTGS